MKNENVDVLIEQNNELRGALNAENKVYYENILLYMRCSALFENDLEIEHILLDLLRDLLVAQKNGESAVDYFGKNPQEMCQALIDNTHKLSVKTISKTVVPILAIYVLTSVCYQLINPQLTINLFQLLIGMLGALFVVWATFRVIKRSAFNRRKMFSARNLVPTIAIFTLLILLGAGAFLVPSLLAPNLGVVTIPAPYDLLLIILLIIAVLAWAFTGRNEGLKSLMPVFLLMGTFAIIARTPLGTGLVRYFSESKDKMLVGAGLLYIVVMLGFCAPVLILLWRDKKHKKTNN